MATYTTYTNGRSIAGKSGSNAAGFPGRTVLVGVYDAMGRNGAAADVFEVITVPAGTLVEHVGYEVITADATQTMSIGDGSSTAGWVSAADVGTAGNTGCSTLALTEGAPNTVTGYSAGKYYSAADTIDILVPSSKAYDTLKVKVFAVCTVIGL